LKNNQIISRKKFISSKKYVVGVDPCKSRMDCMLFDSFGIPIDKPFSVQTNLKGFSETFLDQVSKKVKRSNSSIERVHPDEIVIAIEHSLDLWQIFAEFMKSAGYHVVLVNPVATKHSRPLDNVDFSKTDFRDASIIGELAQRGKFTDYQKSAEKYQLARKLTIHLFKKSKDRQTYRSRFTAYVRKYFPELERLVSSRTRSFTHLAMRFFQTNGFEGADVIEELQELRSIRNFRITQERVQKIFFSSKYSIGLPIVSNSERTIVTMIAEDMFASIEKVENSIKSMEKELKQCFYGDPEFKSLITIKGISDITACKLLAELEGFHKFRNSSAIEKLAGVNLHLNDSGKYSGLRVQSKIGNKRLRTILFIICQQMAQYDPSVRTKYLSLQLKRRCYRKNIMSLSSKVLRILFAIGTKHAIYSPKQLEKPKHLENLENKYIQLNRQQSSSLVA